MTIFVEFFDRSDKSKTGVQNVVADRLTRVMSLWSVEITTSKRHMFVEDRRIFPLGGEGTMEAEIPGNSERDDEEGALGLEDIPEVDKHGIFARYHNSMLVTWAWSAL